LLCSGVGQTISRRIGQGPRINEAMLLEMERVSPRRFPPRFPSLLALLLAQFRELLPKDFKHQPKQAEVDDKPD
jgi:hypothetical protein